MKKTIAAYLAAWLTVLLIPVLASAAVEFKQDRAYNDATTASRGRLDAAYDGKTDKPGEAKGEEPKKTGDKTEPTGLKPADPGTGTAVGKETVPDPKNEKKEETTGDKVKAFLTHPVTMTLGGALIGAAFGILGGPVGVVIGGLIGALLGWSIKNIFF